MSFCLHLGLDKIHLNIKWGSKVFSFANIANESVCLSCFHTYFIITCNGSKMIFISNEIFSGNAGIWVQTHVIYYKPVRDEQSSGKNTSGASPSHSSKKGKGSSGKSTSRRNDLWSGK